MAVTPGRRLKNRINAVTGNAEFQLKRWSFEYGRSENNRIKRTAILYENGTTVIGVNWSRVKKLWFKRVGNERRKTKGKTEGKTKKNAV